jgi:chemotaxis protein MotB
LGDILFTSGKADITPEGKAILDKICEVLNNVAAQNQIVMEGHTDNVPIKYSPWKSNWELSSARALSVAHYFIYERGFSPDRFTIHGYGEFRPTADNRTEAGRRQNRRVEIVIQPTKFTKVKLGEITSQPVTRPSLPKE